MGMGRGRESGTGYGSYVTTWRKQAISNEPEALWFWRVQNNFWNERQSAMNTIKYTMCGVQNMGVK